jgi:sugar phosphate isomerase/epimerase
MYLTGIADEAGAPLEAQIKATRALGWSCLEGRAVQVPGFAPANFQDLPEPAFEMVEACLAEAGLNVCCFGSTIMNWSKRVQDPFEETLAEIRRAIPRMRRLGVKLVRIMSFKPGEDEDRTPPVVFERVRVAAKMFLDADIQPAHENCMNYGGMSWRHAVELLEECPQLKWLFDTANPILNPDRSKPRPWPRQDPWEFWTKVRERVVHIHVKDATWVAAKNDVDYHWPGEGQGRVRDILKDALGRGYDAGISIEPHMAVVFHDASVKSAPERQYDNYVEYGRRVAGMLEEIRGEAIKA